MLITDWQMLRSPPDWTAVHRATKRVRDRPARDLSPYHECMRNGAMRGKAPGKQLPFGSLGFAELLAKVLSIMGSWWPAGVKQPVETRPAVQFSDAFCEACSSCPSR